ncbi:membrane protein insertase YidC [Patescibacteria group bacterium]|nr:membrane protein insertase YidC [Patescibacteria group bacterium]
MLIDLYNTILYEPLFNILMFFYNVVPIKDIGFSIILITILVRLLLYPLSKSSIQSQKKLQELKPQIDELKAKHKDDKEAFGKATMELYKREKINPASSCLPLLIQLPILIAVYQVFRLGLSNESFDVLYSFIAHPGTINSMFLGFVNLAEPNTILAVLAGASQYVQSKMIMNIKGEEGKPKEKKEGNEIMDSMGKQMLYMMPLFTVFIGMSLPSGLVLYWLISIVLTVLQQYLIFSKKKKDTIEVIG